MKLTLLIATLLSPLVLASSAQPDAILLRNNAALQGIRDAKLGAPVVGRTLAVVHTCMCDAWAAYDERAVGTP